VRIVIGEAWSNRVKAEMVIVKVGRDSQDMDGYS
jgi:hypothetical protein